MVRIAAAAFAFLLSAGIVSGWTGPTASPPSGNVAAPLNISVADQTKNGWIGLDSLSIFKHMIISGVSAADPSLRYLNFGSAWDASGYGIRDNNGTLEFKNSGGAWSSLQSIIYNYCQGGGCGGASQWTTSGSNIYYNAGNVGIGTASPPYPLTVAGASNNWAAVINWPPAGSSQYYGILVGTGPSGYSQFQNGSGYYAQLANSSWGLYTNGGVYSASSMQSPIYYDQNNTGYYVDPSGASNVNALTAGGTIRTNSGYYIGGAAGATFTGSLYCYSGTFSGGILTGVTYGCAGNDVAERFFTDGALAVERGLIVALSPETSQQHLTVTNPAAGESTSTPYTMTVAKIHVAEPGEREAIYGAVPTRAFVIGEDGGNVAADTQLVTLAGHVPLHLTLENGSIVIGDPITLSSMKAGFGTKAITPGRIIGYALAPYSGGPDDMIEVSIRPEYWQPAGEICASDANGSTCLTRDELEKLLGRVQ